MVSLTKLSALVALASSVLGATQPVTLLFQNNVNWTDDGNHISVLLLSNPISLAQATAACSDLGETLLSSTALLSHAADFVPQFRYLAYQHTLSSSGYWTSDKIATFVDAKIQLHAQSSHANLPALCTQTSTTNEITVQSKSNLNTFVGLRNQKSFRFLGIPYSDPVTRFRYSTVNSQKNTRFDATSFGAQCFQSGTANYSEQCLFLNIFTPSIPSNANALKPVLFWIHGGAFTGGSGSDLTFDGGNLASRGDLVVVTINYRLSNLGFLNIPGTNITGNYGIGDQITALNWVQQNIAAFGGDPRRVTIAGQSAGAGSVRALLASPLAHGKYSAAIPGSNLGGYSYGTTYSLYSTDQATAASSGVLQATNCTQTTSAEIESCLDALSPSTLVNLAAIARFVIVDGTIIVADGLNVTSPGASGFTAQVPVLWGTTADDGAPFISYPANNATLTSEIEAIGLPSDITTAVIQSGKFPMPNTGNTTLDIFNVTSRIATDAEFRCLDQATVFSGAKHNAFPAIFYYQFDRSYQTSGWPNLSPCEPTKTPEHPLGDLSLPYLKCHSGELYYEFGTMGQFQLPFRDSVDLPFTQLIMDYFTSFIRTHDPNPDPAYLAARGYDSTLAAVKQAGRWEKVSAKKPTLQRLYWPGRQDTFQELEQCNALELGLDFFE